VFVLRTDGSFKFLNYWGNPTIMVQGEKNVNIKTVLKTSVAAAALMAVAAPAVVSPAQAELSNGNKNKLVMSGQIARSLVYQDNGQDASLFNVDGIDTATRLRWIASGQMTESVTVGGIIEMNMPRSNSTYSLGQRGTADTSTDAATWGMRKTEVTFAHKAAGKFYIGQGSAAGDGASTNSLGSWGPSMSAQGAGGAGSSAFVNSATNALTGITVGSATGQYDPGRIDRIRYDTPSFGGLKLSASLGANSQSGVGASYGGKFGGIQVSAGAFYQKSDGAAGNVDGTMGGSVAIKHDSGLSAHLGYTREDSRTGIIEGKEWHGGIGYAASLTNLGTTGFAVNYTRADDSTSIGDQGEILGLAVNQSISSVGTDVFLSYSRVSYDDTTATNYDDFSAIMAGTRLKF